MSVSIAGVWQVRPSYTLMLFIPPLNHPKQKACHGSLAALKAIRRVTIMLVLRGTRVAFFLFFSFLLLHTHTQGVAVMLAERVTLWLFRPNTTGLGHQPGWDCDNIISDNTTWSKNIMFLVQQWCCGKIFGWKSTTFNSIKNSHTDKKNSIFWKII